MREIFKTLRNQSTECYCRDNDTIHVMIGQPFLWSFFKVFCQHQKARLLQYKEQKCLAIQEEALL